MRIKNFLLILLLFCEIVKGEGFIAGALMATPFAAISFACPPAGIGLTVAKAITAGIMCCVSYSAYKKHCKKKKQKTEQKEQAIIVYNNTAPGNGKDPKDEEKDKNDLKKYPNGIYKGVKYHHKQSCGRKSPGPESDGQELLNNAIKIEGNETDFINVDGDQFVVFRETSHREYHAYRSKWGDLTQFMKNTLVRNKLAKRNGKIILKEIIQSN